MVNAQLGRYTNFVNLLDLCGLALPAGYRNDGLPFADVVFRTTLMTALFAALTVGTLYLILRSLRLHRGPAVLACALFAGLLGQRTPSFRRLPVLNKNLDKPT